MSCLTIPLGNPMFRKRRGCTYGRLSFGTLRERQRQRGASRNEKRKQLNELPLLTCRILDILRKGIAYTLAKHKI